MLSVSSISILDTAAAIPTLCLIRSIEREGACHAYYQDLWRLHFCPQLSPLHYSISHRARGRSARCRTSGGGPALHRIGGRNRDGSIQRGSARFESDRR